MAKKTQVGGDNLVDRIVDGVAGKDKQKEITDRIMQNISSAVAQGAEEGMKKGKTELEKALTYKKYKLDLGDSLSISFNGKKYEKEVIKQLFTFRDKLQSDMDKLFANKKTNSFNALKRYDKFAPITDKSKADLHKSVEKKIRDMPELGKFSNEIEEVFENVKRTVQFIKVLNSQKEAMEKLPSTINGYDLAAADKEIDIYRKLLHARQTLIAEMNNLNAKTPVPAIQQKEIDTIASEMEKELSKARTRIAKQLSSPVIELFTTEEMFDVDSFEKEYEKIIQQTLTTIRKKETRIAKDSKIGTVVNKYISNSLEEANKNLEKYSKLLQKTDDVNKLLIEKFVVSYGSVKALGGATDQTDDALFNDYTSLLSAKENEYYTSLYDAVLEREKSIQDTAQLLAKQETTTREESKKTTDTIVSGNNQVQKELGETEQAIKSVVDFYKKYGSIVDTLNKGMTYDELIPMLGSINSKYNAFDSSKELELSLEFARDLATQMEVSAEKALVLKSILLESQVTDRHPKISDIDKKQYYYGNYIKDIYSVIQSDDNPDQQTLIDARNSINTNTLLLEKYEQQATISQNKAQQEFKETGAEVDTLRGKIEQLVDVYNQMERNKYQYSDNIWDNKDYALTEQYLGNGYADNFGAFSLEKNELLLKETEKHFKKIYKLRTSIQNAFDKGNDVQGVVKIDGVEYTKRELEELDTVLQYLIGDFVELRDGINFEILGGRFSKKFKDWALEQEALYKASVANSEALEQEANRLQVVNEQLQKRYDLLRDSIVSDLNKLNPNILEKISFRDIDDYLPYINDLSDYVDMKDLNSDDIYSFFMRMNERFPAPDAAKALPDNLATAADKAREVTQEATAMGQVLDKAAKSASGITQPTAQPASGSAPIPATPTPALAENLGRATEEATKTAEEATKIDTALDDATESSEKFVGSQEKGYRTVKKTRKEIEAYRAVYKKMKAAAKQPPVPTPPSVPSAPPSTPTTPPSSPIPSNGTIRIKKRATDNNSNTYEVGIGATLKIGEKLNKKTQEWEDATEYVLKYNIAEKEYIDNQKKIIQLEYEKQKAKKNNASQKELDIINAQINEYRQKQKIIFNQIKTDLSNPKSQYSFDIFQSKTQPEIHLKRLEIAKKVAEDTRKETDATKQTQDQLLAKQSAFRKRLSQSDTIFHSLPEYKEAEKIINDLTATDQKIRTTIEQAEKSLNDLDVAKNTTKGRLSGDNTLDKIQNAQNRYAAANNVLSELKKRYIELGYSADEADQKLQSVYGSLAKLNTIDINTDVSAWSKGYEVWNQDIKKAKIDVEQLEKDSRKLAPINARIAAIDKERSTIDRNLLSGTSKKIEADLERRVQLEAERNEQIKKRNALYSSGVKVSSTDADIDATKLAYDADYKNAIDTVINNASTAYKNAEQTLLNLGFTAKEVYKILYDSAVELANITYTTFAKDAAPNEIFNRVKALTDGISVLKQGHKEVYDINEKILANQTQQYTIQQKIAAEKSKDLVKDQQSLDKLKREEQLLLTQKATYANKGVVNQNQDQLISQRSVDNAQAINNTLEETARKKKELEQKNADTALSDALNKIEALNKATSELNVLRGKQQLGGDYTKEIDAQIKKVRELSEEAAKARDLVEGYWKKGNVNFSDFNKVSSGYASAKTGSQESLNYANIEQQKSAIAELDKALKQYTQTYYELVKAAASPNNAFNFANAKSNFVNAFNQLKTARELAKEYGVEISKIEKIETQVFDEIGLKGKDFGVSAFDKANKSIDDFAQKIKRLGLYDKTIDTTIGGFREQLIELYNSLDLTTNQGLGRFINALLKLSSRIPAALTMAEETARKRFITDKQPDYYKSIDSALGTNAGESAYTYAQVELDRLNKEFIEGNQSVDQYEAKIQKLVKSLYGLVGVSTSEADAMNQMEAYAMKVSNGHAKIDETSKKAFASSQKLTYTWTDEAGAVHYLTQSYNAVNGQILRVSETSKKAITGLSAFFQSLSDKWKSVFRYFLSFGSIYRVWGIIKQGYSIIKELDTGMTNLAKVSDESRESLDKFGKESFDIAKQVAATSQTVIDAATEWARLGYSIQEASELAKASTIYANVGELDATTATTDLVSTMKAFDIEAEHAMTVVDSMNEIGNNYAVSSAQLGTILEKSSATLAVSGDTIDQVIAMGAAMNEVTQDASVTGTTLKMLGLRIRGAKTEIEDAGESTDGMAESTSKLREKILALTNVDGTGGFDIMLNEKTFKTTYDIMKGIADVWEDMSQIDQAALLELIAGKNRAQGAAALIKNFAKAEEALQDSLNAEGSAQQELDRYMDSIAGRTDLLKNSWQELWSVSLNDLLVKDVLNLATGLTEAATAAGGLLPIVMQLGSALIGIKNLGRTNYLNNQIQLFSIKYAYPY